MRSVLVLRGECGTVRWLKFERCDTKRTRLQMKAAGEAVRVRTVLLREVGA